MIKTTAGRTIFPSDYPCLVGFVTKTTRSMRIACACFYRDMEFSVCFYRKQHVSAILQLGQAICPLGFGAVLDLRHGANVLATIAAVQHDIHAAGPAEDMPNLHRGKVPAPLKFRSLFFGGHIENYAVIRRPLLCNDFSN